MVKYCSSCQRNPSPRKRNRKRDSWKGRQTLTQQSMATQSHKQRVAAAAGTMQCQNWPPSQNQIDQLIPMMRISTTRFRTSQLLKPKPPKPSRQNMHKFSLPLLLLVQQQRYSKGHVVFWDDLQIHVHYSKWTSSVCSQCENFGIPSSVCSK